MGEFRGRAILGLLFLVSGVAQADAFEGGGFFTPVNLPAKPFALERAFNSVVKVGDCSAVILSKQGHVATSIHCLKSCLNPHVGMEYEPQVTIETVGGKDGQHFKGQRVREQVPTRLQCPLFSMINLNIFEYNLDDPKILWIGKGRHIHDENHIAEISDEDFHSFVDLTEDVAILKYEVNEDSGDFPCTPVAQDRVSDDKLWAIGRPSRNTRTTGHNALGYATMVSLGKVRTSVKDDAVLQEIAANLPASLQEKYWQREQQIWEAPHILISSTDAMDGNSGGALINSNGELEGVAFSMTRYNYEKYEGASLMAVRGSHIRREIARTLGARVAQEVFNCPRAGTYAEAK